MTNDTTSDRWAPIWTAGQPLAHLQTHLAVLLIVVVAELIGTITFPLGLGQVVLLSLPYAVVLGLALSYSILESVIELFRSVVDEDVSRIASPPLTVALIPLGVKYGTLVMPSFYDLVAAGPVLVLQESGSLGTILIVPPFTLLLNLRRKSVGVAVNIAREPTLSVITDEYGIKLPEGRDILRTYMTDTVFGTVFFDLPGDFAPAMGLYPLALSMARGMRPVSMMTTCSTSLVVAIGGADIAGDQIPSFAAMSSLLTGITGLYMVILVDPPVVICLYTVLMPVSGRDTTAADGGE